MADNFQIACQQCGQSLASRTDPTGLSVTCPRCRAQFIVPSPEDNRDVSLATGDVDHLFANEQTQPAPAATEYAEPGQPIPNPQYYQPVQPVNSRAYTPVPTGPGETSATRYPQEQYYQPNYPPIERYTPPSGWTPTAIIGLVLCILIAIVIVLQVWPTGSADADVPPPPVQPVSSLMQEAKAITSDKAAAYYLSEAFHRAAFLLEKDGTAKQPQLVTNEQVGEDFSRIIGAFSVAGRYEGKFEGLPELVAKSLTKSGFPATEGQLTPQAREAAVDAFSALSEAFGQVADGQ